MVLSICVYSQQSKKNSKIDSLLNIVKAEKDNIKKVNALTSLSKENNINGNFIDAEKYSTEAISLARKLDYILGEADAYFFLSESFRRRKNFESAIENINKAREIYEKIKSTQKKDHIRGIAECLHSEGLIAKSKSETEKALQLLNDVIDFCIKNNEDEVLSKAYNNVGQIYSDKLQHEKAVECYMKAKNLKIKINDNRGAGISLLSIANVYFNINNYNKATFFAEQALDYFKKASFNDGISSSFIVIGLVNDNLGNYDEAIKFLQKALVINETSCNWKRYSEALNNIGTIYSKMEKQEDALSYHKKALEKRREVNDVPGIIQSLNNIGLILCRLEKVNTKKEYYLNQNKAIENYNEALALLEKHEIPGEKARALHNIGESYLALKEPDKAIEYFSKALEIKKATKNMSSAANSMFELGRAYVMKKDNNKAETMLKSSLEVYLKLNEKDEISKVSRELYMLLKSSGMYKDALQYCENFAFYKDSVLGEKTQKIVNELQTKYETGKKEQQIKLLDSEKKLNETRIRQQMFAIIGFVSGFVLILIFSIVIYKQFRDKKKANILLALQKSEIEEKNEELNLQNEEIRSQRDEINRQKDLVQEKNVEILDSIHYAKRIQNAVLHDIESGGARFAEYFIMFKPKDLVSGDFYFIKYFEKQDILVIAAADCTGHGVPGAFMSMLGISFLNEICVKEVIQHSNEVLDALRLSVIKSLHQTGKEGEQKDGMDISLAVFFNKKRIVEFSGANNPLYLVRNGELMEYKGDKMPIGIHDKSAVPFSMTEIPFESNDCFYLFSDGFADQFGGEKGKKYLYKKFKELILNISVQSPESQKQLLERESVEWRGNIEQIDDQLIVGVKIV